MSSGERNRRSQRRPVESVQVEKIIGIASNEETARGSTCLSLLESSTLKPNRLDCRCASHPHRAHLMKVLSRYEVLTSFDPWCQKHMLHSSNNLGHLRPLASDSLMTGHAEGVPVHCRGSFEEVKEYCTKQLASSGREPQCTLWLNERQSRPVLRCNPRNGSHGRFMNGALLRRAYQNG